MKKNILTIIIMASCLLNLILTAVIVFAVVPTMNKTSQLVDKVATAIDLETDEEASGDYSIDNLITERELPVCLILAEKIVFIIVASVVWKVRLSSTV